MATSLNQQPSNSSIQPSQPCRHFEFREILIATENFAESLVIGKGGFGKVYKGNVTNGSSIVISAIKRLDSMSNQGASEFWAEVEMLSRLRHCNLVSLIGYCKYEKEMILVYEYMPNGTLYDHLHKLGSPLSWLQRLNICIGAGRGLHYLHTGTGIESGVIHRDVKSSNILLHESWAAKISDFGLSKIGLTNQPSTYVNTLIKGTFGYFDPNYYATGKLTRKSDVYAFGVVFLEVLCRKRAVDNSLDEDQCGLVPWVQDSIKEGNLKHIIDSDIRGEISPKCLKEFVKIAERCLHSSPKQRPTMAEVVVSLESILALQQKYNNSAQFARGTLFGRMANMFPFPSNRENKENSGFPEILEVPAGSQSPSQSVKEYTFDDLNEATRGFRFSWKEGGRNNVFLGWVDKNTLAPLTHGDGIAVAVKRFTSESPQGYDEWHAQVDFLGQLDHPNIIRFIGYCRDEQKHEHMIVYNYMPGKSFDHVLFTDKPDIVEPLSWGTRLLIMIGAARGLRYLHSKTLTHGDLQTSHIFLNEEFNAKLGGFWFKKCDTETRVAHSRWNWEAKHYKAPEYFEAGDLSVKSDIYSFGVVLLESMSGRSQWAYSHPSLVDWASTVKSNVINVKNKMDARLQQSYPLQGAFECFKLALRCLANKPKDRPSSKEVLHSLERIYAQDK